MVNPADFFVIQSTLRRLGHHFDIASACFDVRQKAAQDKTALNVMKCAPNAIPGERRKLDVGMTSSW